MAPDRYLDQEPPTGSVVAIDWGGPYQEVWVSNGSNIGNWYCPDIPMRGDQHPHWQDVQRRAEGRTLTLLVPAPEDAYATGFDAGVATVSHAVAEVIDEARLGVTMPDVVSWNPDKPHRCPACHAVAIDMERPSRWRVYTCCQCGTRFARWPRLARFLPKAGIRCSEHHGVSRG